MKIYLLILFLISVISNISFGQEFTVDSDNRNLMFDSADIKIIKRANTILLSKSYWNKVDDRKCKDDIDSNKYSLFCALYKASIDITGAYNHRKPGLQQIRWVIDDKYSNRLDKHRLMDFNNHMFTTFDEIKSLFSESIKIIEQKILED